jgi:Cytochrome c3
MWLRWNKTRRNRARMLCNCPTHELRSLPWRGGNPLHMRLATVSLFILLLQAGILSDEKTHDLCKVCHGETVQDFLSHPHSKNGLDCSTCHGESVKHRSSQGHTEPDRIAAPDEVPALCGGCHAGKGSTTIQAQYSSSKHGQRVLAKARVRAPHCGTCHGSHSLRALQAVQAQCKRCHVPLPASCAATPASAKARVSCANCHAAHVFGAKGSKE